jgi:hypothetical protein
MLTPARLDDHLGSFPGPFCVSAVLCQIELFDDASVFSIFSTLDLDMDFR